MIQLRVALAPPLVGWQRAMNAPPPHGEWLIEADGDETLGSVVARTAGTELKEWSRLTGGPVVYTISSLVLSSGEELELGETPLLDAAGRLRVALNVESASVAELVRAHEAGLVSGDPQQLVVRPQPPVAAVGGGGWDTFAEALQIPWDVVGEAAKVGEAAAGIGVFVWLFRKAGEVLERHASEFDDAGIRPTQLRRFLALRAWTTDELCRALALSSDEVAELMPGLAFEEWADGLWHPAADDRAVAVADDLVRLASSYEAAVRDHDRLAARYRDYLAQLAS